MSTEHSLCSRFVFFDIVGIRRARAACEMNDAIKAWVFAALFKAEEPSRELIEASVGKVASGRQQNLTLYRIFRGASVY